MSIRGWAHEVVAFRGRFGFKGGDDVDADAVTAPSEDTGPTSWDAPCSTWARSRTWDEHLPAEPALAGAGSGPPGQRFSSSFHLSPLGPRRRRFALAERLAVAIPYPNWIGTGRYDAA